MAIRLSRRDLARLTALGVGSIALPLARLAPTIADSIYIEVFPTSPLVLNPFTETLTIPKALAPVPSSVYSGWANRPGPGAGQQSATGRTHQLWPSASPIIYQLKLQVGTHSFTSSDVLPIDSNGRPTVSFDADGKLYPAGMKRKLPYSTIYGFNSNWDNPDRPVKLLAARINAEYGKPCLVRFENELANNHGLDRQDFGSPE
ncbi:MAG TPA: copper oxidase, partial [Chloroflexota bacterium]